MDTANTRNNPRPMGQTGSVADDASESGGKFGVTHGGQVVELGGLAAELAPDMRSLSLVPEDINVGLPMFLRSGVGFWRNLLLLADADFDPNFRVIGGYVDFLTVRPDEPDLDDTLSLSLNEIGYPEQAEVFAELVANPRELGRLLAGASVDPQPDLMVLTLDVFVDPCLRGHHFGLALLQSVWHYGMGMAAASHELKQPAFVGHVRAGTPTKVAEHWARELSATLTDDALMVTADDAVISSPAIDDPEYITVDVAGLRARLAADDPTLWPMHDGRQETEISLVDVDVPEIAEQATSAGALAAEARVYDEMLRAEVVTRLRFSVNTDNDELSEPFARAADYLHEHPDVSVVSASWSQHPLMLGRGHRLTLELIVRVDPT